MATFGNLFSRKPSSSTSSTTSTKAAKKSKPLLTSYITESEMASVAIPIPDTPKMKQGNVFTATRTNKAVKPRKLRTDLDMTLQLMAIDQVHKDAAGVATWQEYYKTCTPSGVHIRFLRQLLNEADRSFAAKVAAARHDPSFAANKSQLAQLEQKQKDFHKRLVLLGIEVKEMMEESEEKYCEALRLLASYRLFTTNPKDTSKMLYF